MEAIKGRVEVEAEHLANPFPGLRPFELQEGDLFFGRDEQVEQLLHKLSSTRFVAVVGTSGCGKSSLIRAGLLPTLLGGFTGSSSHSWRIAVTRPGSNPFSSLARALNTPEVSGTERFSDAESQAEGIEAALRVGSFGLVEYGGRLRMRPEENLLVVIDQFEELFRFARLSADESKKDEAAAFIKLLLTAASQRLVPVYLIVIMRADFVGDCVNFRGLPEVINSGQYLIPNLTRLQLRDVITCPVAVGGGEITFNLVNRLLNDAGGGPDYLPALQHAMMRMWEAWKVQSDYSPIDIQHYEKIGGIRDALSMNAEEAFDELPGQSRPLAEKLFKCLTELGADNRAVRRPASLREICAVTETGEREVQAVVETFRREGRSFLMPPPTVELTPDTLIDIAHESLIRGWRRLRDWMEEEAQSARVYLRLAESAQLHRSGQESLMRDPALQLALDWHASTRPNEAWAQRYHSNFDEAMDFLRASAAERDLVVAQQERQRNQRVRLRNRGLAVLSMLLVMMAGLTVYALQQRKVANEQQRIAEEQRNKTQLVNAELERAKAVAEEAERVAKAQALKLEALAEAKSRGRRKRPE
jgi:energy-coupling factor transporter ATP-binding protein EcfA2